MDYYCIGVQEQLSAYIDKKVSNIEKTLINNHLKTCPDCRYVLNQLKLVDWNLRNEDEIEIPAIELEMLRKSTIDAEMSTPEKNSITKTNTNQSNRTTHTFNGNKNKNKKQNTMQKTTFATVYEIQQRNIRKATMFTEFIPGLNKSGQLVQYTGKKIKDSIFSRISKSIGG
ncbi:hypothetical protein BHU72_10600 [Desulfuribacillus stibiiarsenatis]|uniref:Putative zinc-finger domain-containing protein n=1 Tax=Desulfuribacillus stibiiarsenatis TaxID=1390249 RepID=A0A1E5L2C0_9FIRM|nr:zf-HC2 domain-containing protein [Desulfuribacillus stibiiarsenatis]OEH84256.1 hypothetical protein BHU72_10600 [Desulfuribacillus stibiiarsenatis]